MITFENFFLNTKARFKGCKIPLNKAPNFTSYSRYSGRVSSTYYYGEDKKGKFVIRVSYHWSTLKGFNKNNKIQGCGSIASCYWTLKTNNNEELKAGKCYLKDFKLK